MNEAKLSNFCSRETEEVLLSALLVQGDSITEVVDILKPEMFYFKETRLIYSTILALYDSNEAIDSIIVSNKLMEQKKLEAIGGFSYVIHVSSKVASSHHLRYHAQIVFQLHITRQLDSVLSRSRNTLHTSENADILDIYNNTFTELEQLMSFVMSNGLQPISEHIKEAQNCIYKRVESYRKNEFIGITTGLRGLDEITGGWKGNQLIVLAARPAMGKTALLLHFAISAAQVNNHVCIYSLEMGTISLLDRMIHRNTNIHPFAYKQGSITNEGLHEVEKSISLLEKLPIYIDDKAGCTIRYIRTNAKLQHKQGKCNMILIDYLQIMDMEANIGRNREQEVANTTRELKMLSKELDIPIIILSQLSRGVESRHDKRPMLSDLRESGAIEQDSDTVMFLFRPEYYGITEITEGARTIDTEGYGEIIIGKQREGAVGTVEFKYNKSLTQISNYNDFTPIPLPTNGVQQSFSIDEDKKF